MDAAALLLRIAFQHRVIEPAIEAGFERFLTLSGKPVPFGAFQDAVAACVRDRLIHDPVRLPEGALQCHWHLELTASGVAEARRRMLAGDDRRDPVGHPAP